MDDKKVPNKGNNQVVHNNDVQNQSMATKQFRAGTDGNRQHTSRQNGQDGYGQNNQNAGGNLAQENRVDSKKKGINKSNCHDQEGRRTKAACDDKFKGKMADLCHASVKKDKKMITVLLTSK